MVSKTSVSSFQCENVCPGCSVGSGFLSMLGDMPTEVQLMMISAGNL